MRRDKVTIYRAADGWRWRYTTPNGHVLGDSGQAYSRRIDAVRGVCRVLGMPPAWVNSILEDLRAGRASDAIRFGPPGVSIIVGAVTA